jgi:hypothetical protein
MACHNLDPAFWALKLGYPTSVEASRCKGSAETAPHASIVHFEFPARGAMPPVSLHWYDGGLTPQRPAVLEPGRKMGENGNGILFVGSKGIIMCPGWAGNPRLIPETAMRAYKRPPKTLLRTPGHHRDWLNACKNGGQSSSNFSVAGPMVEVILMGLIAIRTTEKLYWDGPNMRCTNLDAANEFVRPNFRSGWLL